MPRPPGRDCRPAIDGTERKAHFSASDPLWANQATSTRRYTRIYSSKQVLHPRRYVPGASSTSTSTPDASVWVTCHTTDLPAKFVYTKACTGPSRTHPCIEFAVSGTDDVVTPGKFQRGAETVVCVRPATRHLCGCDIGAYFHEEWECPYTFLQAISSCIIIQSSHPTPPPPTLETMAQ